MAGADWQAPGLFLLLSSKEGKGDKMISMPSRPFESSSAVRVARWKQEEPCVVQR